jgi:mRNA interferase RelE/StbE
LAYEVVVVRSAERELKGLSIEARRRIASRLLELAVDPHPAQSIRLRGIEGFRLRVGDYRIIYNVDDVLHVVTNLAMGHRRHIYRDM